MNWRAVLLFAAVILALGGLTTGAVLLWPKPAVPVPEPRSQTPQDVVKYVASADFDKLPPARKDDYFAQVAATHDNPGDVRAWSRGLSDEERSRLRRNIRPLMEKVEQKRIDKYFDMPKEDRSAYLDKIIDQEQAMQRAMMEEMQRRAEERQQGRADRPTTEPGRASRTRPAGIAQDRGPRASNAGSNAGNAARQGSGQRNASPNAGNAARQGGGQRNADPVARQQQAVQRTRNWIELHSPEWKAKYIEYQQQLAKRRAEREPVPGLDEVFRQLRQGFERGR